MSRKINSDLEEFTWLEIRDTVAQVNPEFVKQVDVLDPSNDLSVFKASYSYGELLLNEGVFNVPIGDDEYAPIHDSRVPADIQKKLGYSPTIPMGMTLNRSVELFIGIDDERIMPFAVMSPGWIFALSVVLVPKFSCDKGKIWSMSAGARTTFLLPKISSKMLYRGLQLDYGVSFGVPRSLADHWYIFSSIANAPSVKNKWRLEVLFFSSGWLENKKDPPWVIFRYYLLERLWKNAFYWNNHFFHEMVLSRAQSSRGLLPDPNMAKSASHLFYIGSGACPGLGVAVDNSCLPLKLLQKAFIESYGLKNYSPTIMVPTYISANSSVPVYYSLPFPTLIDFSPTYKKMASTLGNLRELKYIMDETLKEVLANNLGLEKNSPSVYKIAQNTSFEYFHHEKDLYCTDIKSTNEIPNKDKSIKTDLNKFADRTFASANQCMRGCVQIKAKKQEN